MRFSTSLLLAVSAVSAVLASDVHELNADNFETFFENDDANSKPVLLEFFAPWCGHCKALAPSYEEAATALKSQDIRLAKLDCDANGALCQKYGVQGYPTLKVVHGGDVENAKPYSGQRTTDAIITYMEKQSKDVVEPLVSSEALDTFKSHKISFVVFHDKDDKASYDTFKQSAEAFRDESYLFGAVTDPAVAKAEGISFPAVVAYRDFDEPKVELEGKIESDAINAFVRRYVLHLFGEVGPDTYAAYSNAGIPLGFVFVEDREDKALADVMGAFKEAAKKHHGKVNIATIDAKIYGSHADKVNLSGDKWPAFAIHDFATNKKYVFDESNELTPKAIATFVDEFVEGKIPATVKSEPIPTAEQQDETAVTIVVGHTYSELVEENDLDVLIEYYAPWCGHCKKLAPDYELLAAQYKPFADKVRIAKVDATSNDVDASIHGFPTIKLFAAGKKDKPADYSGPRTPESLAEFIAAEGTYKINAYTDKAPEAEEEPVVESSSAAESSATSATESEAAKETKDEKDEL